jgi:hypothetical protein
MSRGYDATPYGLGVALTLKHCSSALKIAVQSRESHFPPQSVGNLTSRLKVSQSSLPDLTVSGVIASRLCTAIFSADEQCLKVNATPNP